MALGTYFHFNILFCAAGFDYIAASAGNRSRSVLGMNFFFHALNLFSRLTANVSFNSTQLV
jgi:hypothetical protein